MRDKFRMQSGGGAVTASDHTAADRASCSGNDSNRAHADGASSSATIEQISSEEIRSLDRSPQRGITVKGRRESGSNIAAKTTSPSGINVKVDSSQRSTVVRSRSPEKVVHSQTTVCSPVRAARDHGSVISPQHVRLPNSGSRKPSGHVSDSAFRRDGVNDCKSRRSTSGACRRGYVSDTSFSAVVNNAANDSLRSTSIEGVSFMCVLEQNCRCTFQTCRI